MKKLISAELIERRIYLIRDQKVMLDRDLAELYEVDTRSLNQAVKRNLDSFPQDFMFQLSSKEVESLVSQNVIPHKKYLGGHLPYAFTEQGVAMLSSVLKSKRARLVNITIMRAFVRMRNLLASNLEFAQKLADLESRISKNEVNIQTVSKVIRDLLNPAPDLFDKPKRNIGFLKESRPRYSVEKKELTV